MGAGVRLRRSPRSCRRGCRASASRRALSGGGVRPIATGRPASARRRPRAPTRRSRSPRACSRRAPPPPRRWRSSSPRRTSCGSSGWCCGCCSAGSSRSPSTSAGIVMIVLMALLLRRVRLAASSRTGARARSSTPTPGHQHHTAGEQLSWRQRLTSASRLVGRRAQLPRRLADAVEGDHDRLPARRVRRPARQRLLQRPVPHAARRRLVQTVWGAFIGPVIAVLSFVCSVGNVPLAAVLWCGGISFAGVMAFIFADLIVLPILAIYRKYYGTRSPLRITALMFVTMVVAALDRRRAVQRPGPDPGAARARPRPTSSARSRVDYKLVLNVAGAGRLRRAVLADRPPRRDRPGVRHEGRPRQGRDPEPRRADLLLLLRALPPSLREGQRGKLTVIVSPPSGCGRAFTVAPWAVAIARTIDSPSPWWPSASAARPAAEPLERLEQPVDLVRGGPRGPVLVTDSTRAPGLDRGTDLDPPAGHVVVRTALSIRFAMSRSTSAGSPVVGAGSSSVDQLEPAALDLRLRAASSARPASNARSSGSRRSSPRSLLASVSSASSSRSCSRPVASSSSQVARSCSTLASGSASATWSSVRSTVSGVRSSCDAFATNRRWASNERLEPSEQVVERVAELLELVVGSGQREPLMKVAGRDRPRGRGDLAQRAQHPPGDEPAEHARSRAPSSPARPTTRPAAGDIGRCAGGPADRGYLAARSCERGRTLRDGNAGDRARPLTVELLEASR